MRASACFSRLWCTLITLLLTLLVCNVIIKRNCHGSQSCVNLRDARLLSPPLPTTSGGLAPELLSEAQSVINSATGPDDFASMGDAVAKLTNLLQHKPALQSSVADSKHFKIAQQLMAALLHVFPFVTARYDTFFTNQQDQNNITRGLVVPCGAADFQFALHLVAAIRLVFHSTLPIEVMYAGNSDLSRSQRNALEAVGQDITAINILHYFDENIVGLEGSGWAIKPFAILASSFQQVIIADSDSVFLQTPEAAFDHPSYITTGTLFFRDRVVKDGSNVHEWWHSVMQHRTPSHLLAKSAFWSNESSHEMESGVVVFNKGKSNVFLGLLFAAWMNTKLIRSETTYKHILGDKETYWMAFELASIPYHFDDPYASAIGHVSSDLDSGKPLLCPSHLLHLDHQGKPLWYNGSLYRSKRVPKEERTWMNPVVWAPDTGRWDGTRCMLDLEEHGGPRPLSDGGWDQIYQQSVVVAEQLNAQYDALII